MAASGSKMQTSQELLLQSLARSLKSGAYSDLIITCSSDTYKVHKAIVCTRAKFFDGAIKFGGQETQNGKVDLPEDEPAVVKMLIQYLYSGEYDPPLCDDDLKPDPSNTTHLPKITASGGLAIKGTADQLLFHAKMYKVADKYDVEGLEDFAKQEFSTACQHFWDSPEFSIAAHYAFSTTLGHNKGIRGIVSATISEHMELVEKPEIKVLLTQYNGLALGIIEEKIKNCDWSKKNNRGAFAHFG